MKRLILAKQNPRRDCGFNDKPTNLRLPFRPGAKNSSHLPRRWSFVQKCLPVLAIFCCLLLNSCNGGDGGGSLTAGGGIDGTGIMSRGAVTAIGSIEVNGTEFDTTDASVIVNGVEIGAGDEVVEENLQIGMVASVDGRTLDNGDVVADRVIYNSNVSGPVASVGDIDPVTNERTVTVLGQTVVVNFITIFKDTSFEDIAMDDVVTVSGYRDFDGSIRATFVEKTGDITTIVDYEVSGFVENLDTKLKTFMVNDLDVDYASIANNLPQGIPAEGLLVEVEGRLDGGDVLIAADIRLEEELDGEGGNEFEIMGLVTKVVSDFEFTIGNQVVIIDENTEVVDELPGGIQEGVRLEAEGVFEGGVLFADEIEFWKPDQIEIEGIVAEVVSDTIFIIDEQEVITDDETVFEPEDLVVEVDQEIEVKGVPQNLEQSVIEADKVSLEED